jgi:uncharacterized protein
MIGEGPGGVVVEVWVVPGASRDDVGGDHAGALRVRTVAPAEGGRANRAVARLVADALGARHARVIRGSGSRRKTVLVEGVDLRRAKERLARLTDTPS